jgi:CheY-like chemotaxis protein
MDAATLARAFEPFFTTKDPANGTGMGLAVVHGIATRAGAGLSVRSRVQGGSTFSLQFKLVTQTSAEAVATEPENSAPTPGSATVLVCEDAAPLRKAMGRLFKGAQFSVLEATNGQQALALIAQHEVHLVITDLVMPVLDGVALIAALRRQGYSMPILLLSGYPANTLSQLDEAARAGVTTMQKPVEPPLLVEVARRLLSRG